MPNRLTEQDFENAALELLTDVPSIKAVCEVEAPRGGFLSDGRPVILFERHKFHQFTGGRFYAAHPDLCNPARGGYLGGASEWQRFQQAAELDHHAAMMATSWGRFQIMGFNFHHAGFGSVDEFGEAMRESEARQLAAFVMLIKSFRLDDELRQHNWAAFARAYNGPGYREHDYDGRLKAAHQKFARAHERAPIAAPPADQAVYAIAQDSEDARPIEGAVLRTPPVSTPDDPPVEASRDGGRAWAINRNSLITGIGAAAWALFQQNHKLLLVAAGLVGVIAICWFVRSIILDRERMRIAADPSRYNVH